MKSVNSLKWNWAWIQVGNLVETKQNPNVCEFDHTDGYEQLLRVLTPSLSPVFCKGQPLFALTP